MVDAGPEPPYEEEMRVPALGINHTQKTSGYDQEMP